MKYVSKASQKRKQKNKRIQNIVIAACATLMVATSLFFVFNSFKGGFKLPSFSKKNKGYPVTVLGQNIEQEATNIVSLSPLATQILTALPVQDKILATSEYCDSSFLDITTIGTPLIPKIDDIINLMPQYVIVQTPLEEQEKNRLEQSGIKILELTTPTNLEELKMLYINLANLFYGKNTGEDIVNDIFDDIYLKLEMYEKAIQKQDKLNALLLINKYGMVATSDTIEGALLTPFFNINVEGSNYWAGDIDTLTANDYDVIIVGDSISKEQLFELGFGESKAYVEDKIYIVSQKELENFSPKLIMEFSNIATQVYQDKINVITQDDLQKEE